MKRSEIFTRLDPPAGGLATLRARIDRRSERVRLFAAAGSFVVLAAVVALLVRRERASDPLVAARHLQGASEVALGLASMPAAAVIVEPADRGTTALAEVPTRDANVAFYWVSSTRWDN